MGTYCERIMIGGMTISGYRPSYELSSIVPLGKSGDGWWQCELVGIDAMGEDMTEALLLTRVGVVLVNPEPLKSSRVRAKSLIPMRRSCATLPYTAESTHLC